MFTTIASFFSMLILCSEGFLKKRLIMEEETPFSNKLAKTDSKESSKTKNSSKNVKSKPDIKIIPPKTNSMKMKVSLKAHIVKKTLAQRFRLSIDAIPLAFLLDRFYFH